LRRLQPILIFNHVERHWRHRALIDGLRHQIEVVPALQCAQHAHHISYRS
jgi:hypothetical protein